MQGNALEEDVAAFVKAGADAVVTKPFQAAELFAALEPHLLRATAAAAAAEPPSAPVARQPPAAPQPSAAAAVAAATAGSSPPDDPREPGAGSGR